MLSFFIEIGFLEISIWDILDILIVGYLIFQIYRLLRGTMAFNIVIGVMALYAVWWLVGQLEMGLLSSILNQFVSVGVIMLLIIFQPEVRRFLLFVGNTTLKGRFSFWRQVLSNNAQVNEQVEREVEAILKAMVRMGKSKTGALIVFANNANAQALAETGTLIDAKISQPLLESIFHKESPLHDGAVLINNNKILAASCILPVSYRKDIPKSAGLRHRAAIGVTEGASNAAFIVSEESGKLSYAYQGNLVRGTSQKDLKEKLLKHFMESDNLAALAEVSSPQSEEKS